MGTPLTLFLAGHVKCWMMIATAQVVFFFNCIMFMAGSSFPILFLSRTIGGVGSTFLQSGAIAMLDSLYPSSERGNRFVMIYFCGGFGLTMGPLIGGSLSSDGSFIPCLLAALTLAGVFALVMMYLRDNEAEFTKMEPLAPHVRDQQTMLSLASLVLVSSTVAFSEVILPLHLNVAFATTASALGGLLMIAAIAFIFVANVAALVSEKINRNMMMGAGLACNGVAFLALFSPESLAVEVVPVMLLGCSASVVYTGVFLRMVDSVGQGDARSPALQQVRPCAVMSRPPIIHPRSPKSEGADPNIVEPRSSSHLPCMRCLGGPDSGSGLRAIEAGRCACLHLHAEAPAARGTSSRAALLATLCHSLVPEAVHATETARTWARLELLRTC